MEQFTEPVEGQNDGQETASKQSPTKQKWTRNALTF